MGFSVRSLSKRSTQSKVISFGDMAERIISDSAIATFRHASKLKAELEHYPPVPPRPPSHRRSYIRTGNLKRNWKLEPPFPDVDFIQGRRVNQTSLIVRVVNNVVDTGQLQKDTGRGYAYEDSAEAARGQRYMPYVQDKNSQLSRHRRTGWKTFQDVQQRHAPELNGAIHSIIQRAAKERKENAS